MGFMLLTTAPADVIDSLNEARVYVTIVLCSRLTADVGASADKSLLKTVTQLL